MSYIKCHMKRFVLLTFATFLATALAALAVESKYQEATILNVDQKTSTRVLYYIVNTPITKDDPYYEVSVQLKDETYVARFTPRHADDTLPDEWVPGAKVQARVQGRHLFLKDANTSEVQLVITKRKATPTEVPGSSSGNK